MRKDFSAAAIKSASEKSPRDDSAILRKARIPPGRMRVSRNESAAAACDGTLACVTVASRCSPQILRHTSFSPHLMFDRRYTRHAESNSF